jgi:hypothetical protein
MRERFSCNLVYLLINVHNDSFKEKKLLSKSPFGTAPHINSNFWGAVPLTTF